MSFWFWHGLRNGIQSTRYPWAPETASGISPGRPLATGFASAEEASQAAAICPVNAIAAEGDRTTVDLRTCVWCQRCRFGVSHPLQWDASYEWTQKPPAKAADAMLPAVFTRSLHVMVIDAGDCGACLNEVRQLNNPLYNMHRLGIFLTATPRTADVLASGRACEREHAWTITQDLCSDAWAEAGRGRGNMLDHRRCLRKEFYVGGRRWRGPACRSRNSGRLIN